MMQIGLLECDHVLERFRHIAGGYREMFAALFGRHAPHITLRPFEVCHGEFPPWLDSCDAYLATGSRLSAYDDVDWIQALKHFVRSIGYADQRRSGVLGGRRLRH